MASRVNKYYKKWKRVNGRLVDNVEMLKMITNKGEYAAIKEKIESILGEPLRQ